MKERIVRVVCVAGAALALVLVLAAWAESPSPSQEPRLITVTGEAEVRVVPDEVIVTLGVETWDKNLDIAKSRNDEIVKKVLALATDYGIPPEHVQTDYIGVEPRYRDGYYEERDFIGYFVHKTIVITLRDLSKFEDLLSGALKAGVNYVQGIEFHTTELRKHRDEARALAIQAAKEKAIALAGELGQKVGDPQTIQEDQSGWWSGYGAWWGSRWGGTTSQNVIQETGGTAWTGESSVAPGQIDVNARVTVSFELTK
jgi:uncharacterized protein YggE